MTAPDRDVDDNVPMSTDAALIAEAIDLGRLSLEVLRPPDAEALISEEAFERDEFLPYWAEAWPSGIALARHLADQPDAVRGARVLELGCGLGLPSIVAALQGAQVVATDWSVEALRLLDRNARRNGASVEVKEARWSAHDRFATLRPFDLILAADVLYEQRNADEILALLPVVVTPASRLLLADPGRPLARPFLAAARELGYENVVIGCDDASMPRGAIYTVTTSGSPVRR